MSSKARKVQTINGIPLSGDITITKTLVGLGNVPNVDATDPTNMTQSASYRFATDTEKSTWSSKATADDISSAISATPTLLSAVTSGDNVVINQGEIVWVL